MQYSVVLYIQTKYQQALGTSTILAKLYLFNADEKTFSEDFYNIVISFAIK